MDKHRTGTKTRNSKRTFAVMWRSFLKWDETFLSLSNEDFKVRSPLKKLLFNTYDDEFNWINIDQLIFNRQPTPEEVKSARAAGCLPLGELEKGPRGHNQYSVFCVHQSESAAEILILRRVQRSRELMWRLAVITAGGPTAELFWYWLHCVCVSASRIKIRLIGTEILFRAATTGFIIAD